MRLIITPKSSLTLLALFSTLFFTSLFSQTVTHSEDFESGMGGFTTGGTTASTGTFVSVDPFGTTYQLGDDHTPSPGTRALVSAQNTSLGGGDIDGGVTIATSPVYSITNTGTLSLWYFFGQRDNGDDSGDFFKLETSFDNGSNWTTRVSIGDVRTTPSWTNLTVTNIPAGSQLRIRISAADGSSTGDIVEAGLDDIEITEEDAPVDTDGDGVLDSVDIDDDNDGYIDQDETCGAIGTPAEANAEYWNDGNYDIYAVGGYESPAGSGTFSDYNGQGYVSSGFEDQALRRGLTLTKLDDADNTANHYTRESPASTSSPLSLNDKVYFGMNPTTASHDGVATFTTNYYSPDYDADAGLGCATEAYRQGRNSEIRTTTGTEFCSGGNISGITHQAIYVIPERGAGSGGHANHVTSHAHGTEVDDSYSIHLTFNNPIYAFSFDIVDSFDTTEEGPTTNLVEVFAFTDASDASTKKRIAFFRANNSTNDGAEVIDLYQGDETTLVTSSFPGGNRLEITVGFFLDSGFDKVEIQRTIESGKINNCARDTHGIDNLIYAKSPRTCYASDSDYDGDNIKNDLDLDSDNDGIPDNIEFQTTIDYIAPTGNDTDGDGLDDAYDADCNPCGTTYGKTLSPVNSDGVDGVDFVDLDSDNDGTFDIAETGNGSKDSNNDGMIDTLVDTIKNGFDDSLDSSSNVADSEYSVVYGNIVDDSGNLKSNFTQYDADNDRLTIGDLDYRDIANSGIPLITQIHLKGTERWIEVTNIHNSNVIEANAIEIALFKESNTSNNPDAVFNVNSTINPGQSALVKGTGSSLTNFEATSFRVTSPSEASQNVIDFTNGKIVLTHPKSVNSTVWKNHYEIISGIQDNNSYVRIDSETGVTTNVSEDKWVRYKIEANLAHPQSPNITEVENVNATIDCNIKLGQHMITPTSYYNSSWDNGIPDKTRRVIITEDFVKNTPLNARTLEVSGAKFTVDNSLVVVTDDLSISTGNELRLINGAQLIQTHDGASKVASGGGNLLQDQKSVSADFVTFINSEGQEETVEKAKSNYKSLYWSSPVSSNSNGFMIADVLKDGGDALTTNSTIKDINFIENSWNGEPASGANAMKISRRWLSRLSGQLSWDENVDPQAEQFYLGEGWNMKSTGANNQNFTFVGTPNDGDIIINAVQDVYYVLGNPYPSALDGAKFLEDNEAIINPILYFYDSTNDYSHYYEDFAGGYGTLNKLGVGAPAGGANTKTPGRYIPVSQGFLLYTLPTIPGGSTIKFDNSQRRYKKLGDSSNFIARGSSQNNQAYTSEFPILRFALFFNEDGLGEQKRSLAVAFKGKTNDFEEGYDAYMFDRRPTDVGLKSISLGNSPLTISTIEDFNQDLEIPLLVYANKDRSLTFKIDELVNFPSTNIYLKDAETNQYYNISNPSVSVTMDLPAGDYNDRFSIVFKNGGNALSTEELTIENGINAFVDKSTNDIVVQQKDKIASKVILYNLVGQEIANWKNTSTQTELRFNKKDIKTAIYILKVQTEDGFEFSKKIIMN